MRIDGTYPIDDFNEEFGTELPQEDFHTLAGFVFGELGRAPAKGDQVRWQQIEFEVVDIAGTRIGALDIELPPQDEDVPDIDPDRRREEGGELEEMSEEAV